LVCQPLFLRCEAAWSVGYSARWADFYPQKTRSTFGVTAYFFGVLLHWNSRLDQKMEIDR
jgi:hypothetical protein